MVINWQQFYIGALGASFFGSSVLVLAYHNDPWIWGVGNVTGLALGYCLGRLHAPGQQTP
jgi:hypothetical protein